MAVAEQTALLGLGAAWWISGYTVERELQSIVADELARQGEFLVSAWDSANRELLIGVGDQMTETADPVSLLTYSDFAGAPDALAVGPPDESIIPRRNNITDLNTDNLPKQTVAPECSWADDGASPAADVAAHAAAALALGYAAMDKLTKTGDIDLESWVTTAEELLEYSTDMAPHSGRNNRELRAATSAVVDELPTAGETSSGAVASSAKGPPRFGVRLSRRSRTRA